MRVFESAPTAASARTHARGRGHGGRAVCALRPLSGHVWTCRGCFRAPSAPHTQTQGASPGSARQMPTARRPLAGDARHCGGSGGRGAAPSELARECSRASLLRLKGGRYRASTGCLERTRAPTRAHARTRTPSMRVGGSMSHLVTCSQRIRSRYPTREHLSSTHAVFADASRQTEGPN